MLSGSDKSTTIKQLSECLRSIETSCRNTAAAPIRTGWSEVDSALAHGGLRGGAIHECYGVGGRRNSASDWTPPLLIIAHLMRRACQSPAGEPRWSVWIGRRVWLFGQAAVAALGATDRVLWVDASEAGARLWAVEAALRCSGVAVAADGSGFDAASSRRLQLAATSCGTFAILARRAHELAGISFAATRWEVESRPTETLENRWSLRLARHTGSACVGARSWIVERSSHAGLVCLSPDLADRSGAAARAS
jgi:hypothetical protein